MRPNLMAAFTIAGIFGLLSAGISFVFLTIYNPDASLFLRLLGAFFVYVPVWIVIFVSFLFFISE